MKLSSLKFGWAISVMVISLGAAALLPQNLLADGGPSIARLPQDAQSRLSAARSNLDSMQQYLKALQSGPYGGYIAKASADSDQALADIKAASAYILLHPEANKLVVLKDSELDPPATPQTARGSTFGGRGLISGGQQYLNNASNMVNNAMRNLQNIQQQGFRGPAAGAANYLGDLDGNRVKILASLAKVNQDLASANDYSNNPLRVPSAAAAVALQKYEGQITIELADEDGPTVIEIPKKLLDGTAPAGTTSTKPVSASLGNSGSDPAGGQQYFAADNAADFNDGTVPDALPMRALLPSIFASVALSGAFILGGLHFFSRQGRVRLSVPVTACLVVGLLLLGIGITQGQSSPSNTISTPDVAPPPPPPPPPQLPTINTTGRGTPTARGFATAPARGPRGVAAIPSVPAPHVSGNATVYMSTDGDTVHIILSRKNVADLLGQPPAR